MLRYVTTKPTEKLRDEPVSLEYLRVNLQGASCQEIIGKFSHIDILSLSESHLSSDDSTLINILVYCFIARNCTTGKGGGVYCGQCLLEYHWDIRNRTLLVSLLFIQQALCCSISQLFALCQPNNISSSTGIYSRSSIFYTIF